MTSKKFNSVEYKLVNDAVEVYAIRDEDCQIVNQKRLFRINIGYFRVDFVGSDSVREHINAEESEMREVDTVLRSVRAGEEYDPDEFAEAFRIAFRLCYKDQHTLALDDSYDEEIMTDIRDLVQERVEVEVGGYIDECEYMNNKFSFY